MVNIRNFICLFLIVTFCKCSFQNRGSYMFAPLPSDLDSSPLSSSSCDMSCDSNEGENLNNIISSKSLIKKDSKKKKIRKRKEKAICYNNSKNGHLNNITYLKPSIKGKKNKKVLFLMEKAYLNSVHIIEACRKSPSSIKRKSKKVSVFISLKLLFGLDFRIVNEYFISSCPLKGKLSFSNDVIPSKLGDYKPVGRSEKRGSKIKIDKYDLCVSKYSNKEILDAIHFVIVLPVCIEDLILLYVTDNFIFVDLYFRYIPSNENDFDDVIKILIREQTQSKNILLSDYINVGLRGI